MTLPSWMKTTATPTSGGGYSGPDLWAGRRGSSGGSSGYTPRDVAATDYTEMGSMSINPMDPAGSAAGIAGKTVGIFEGLRNALFGVSQQPKRGDNHGGLLGGIPIVSDLARAGTEVVANAVTGVGTAIAAIPSVAGGALEHIPSGADPTAEFNALPDSDIKLAAIEAMKSTGSLVGPASGHIMAQAIQDYNVSLTTKNPSLTADLFKAPASVADTLSDLFGGLTFGQRLVERGIAGAAKPGSADLNQLDVIRGVKEGRLAFTQGGPLGSAKDLTPVEEAAYAMTENGTWTDAQALDFLASHGAGMSHSMLLEVSGSVVLDPLFVGAIGASAIAKAGRTGAVLFKEVQSAETALSAARLTNDAEKISAAQKTLDMAKALTLHDPGVAGSRFNVIRRVTGESKQSADIMRLVGQGYSGMQGTMVGRSAKIARTIIDPFHAMSLGLPRGDKLVDLAGTASTDAAIKAMGAPSHLALMETLDRLVPGGALRSAVSDAFGTYAGNVARQVVGNQYRATVLARKIPSEVMALLRDTVPKDVMDDLMKQATRSTLGSITEQVNRFIVRAWDGPALENLAYRMEKMFPQGIDHDAWLAEIKAMNNEQRSILHAASYGQTNELLMEGIASAKLGVSSGAIKAEGINSKLDRVVIMNEETLTKQGLAGIVKRLDAAVGDVAAQIDEIKAMQDLYPRLNYIPIDTTDLPGTVTKFRKYLARIEPRLNSQIVDEEFATNPALAQLQTDLRAGLSVDAVSRTKTGFNLGFRPEDKYLWGMERTNKVEGLYGAVGDVFVDHVANAAPGARGARNLSFNILGQPITTGALGRAGGRVIDHLEAYAKMLTTQVSGTMISEAARGKFTAKVANTWVKSGIGKADAQEIWDGIHEFVANAGNVITNPRGYNPQSLWNAVNDLKLIPQSARSAGFDRRELMSALLDAYDGDLRFIGATQKLTGRAKAALFDLTGSNALAEIAEHAWPLMKFRLNSVFQGQEKIESWINNGFRGISGPLWSSDMNKYDAIAEKLLNRSVEFNLNRMSDIDVGEESARMMMGKNTRAAAGVPGTQLGKITRANALAKTEAAGKDIVAALMEVKGVKRINMLRTWRKGLGQEQRAIWEKTHPGEWDQMLSDFQLRAGGLVNEDDFAVHLMADKMLGNDIAIKRTMDAVGKFTGFKADFKNSILPGAWYAPTHLGELQVIDLDGTAAALDLGGIRGGKEISSSAELRQAIAAKRVTIDDVKAGLRALNADPDYIRRVQHALEWDDNGFWEQVTDAYHLTPGQAAGLRDMIAETASMRGMTPVDYMSQVFSPNIIGGQDAAVGALGKAVDIILNKQTVTESDLAHLAVTTVKNAAGENVTSNTYDDLVRQMATVFSAHLDPSAKRALLMEFYPDLRAGVQSGKLKLDMAEIVDLWDTKAEGMLADQMIGHVRSTEGDIFRANLARTGDEYLVKHPAATSDISIVSPGKRKVLAKVRDTVGPGLRAMDKELQGHVLPEMDRLQAIVPEVQIAHTDVLQLSKLDPSAGAGDVLAEAFHIRGEKGKAAIFFDSGNLTAGWKADDVTAVTRNEASRAKAKFVDPEFGGLIDRRSNPGVAYHVDPSLIGTVDHEYAHGVHEFIVRSAGKENAARFGVLRKWFKDFYESPANRQMSEYGMVSEKEAAAEAMSLALNPDADLTKFKSTLDPNRFDHLPPVSDTEYWKNIPAHLHPDYVPPADVPTDLEAAILDLRTKLTDSGLLKVVPPPSASPDVVRATRMFSKWSTQALQNSLMSGSTPGSRNETLSRIFHDMGGMPTDEAVPYNQTEALLMNLVQQSMADKWKDAYRLQYFAQSRTMLERSINHPMFGIYPASYMWGKILPEMVRFIAKEPFGVRTGAMAYTLNDVRKFVEMQREYDPEFDALIEKLGHNQAISFLAYMLPALPWDVQAGFPSWMRDLSQQGLVNKDNAVMGKQVKSIDLLKPATDTAKKLAPYLTTLPWAARAAEGAFGDPNAPAKQPAVNGPTQGAGLGEILGTEMQDLRDLLFNR